ncbi:M56 family metallopeptidase [Epibacterium sp. Ofav1-8]|uniref:M56 family metallopeptidase n=1 Tax=Epibacterium sp. Ofav1-8 TaxID=2917735 RepID=UPI001EF68855|nr:M56 family metallopeptidase [Epibacterium sp. Ofav1-8]MCG7624742.1 M56 family metallopeptidase [Epibacterium sp. Ofav1-8]
MKADALLNAYIDLNLLVCAGALLWLVARAGLRRTSLATVYGPQLRLLNGMTVLLAVMPGLVLVLNASGLGHPPTLSDVLVSQYLQGNVSMSASRFETLIGLREDLIRTLSAGSAIWSQIAVVALVSGTLISGALLVRAVMRLRRALASAYHWKRIGRVELLLSDHTAVAYSTRGLRRLYVVLPTALLNDPLDLRLTLAHELQHFRQRDVETAFLMECLRPLLFWNPAFYLWRRDMRAVREFACDQALSARSRFDLRSYCECLIRSTERARKTPIYLSPRSPSVALLQRREIHSAPILARRIIAVTEQRPDGPQHLVWTGVAAAIACAVVATAFLIQRPGDWSHDRIMLSTIVNLERMAHRSAAQTTVSALNGGFVTSSD